MGAALDGMRVLDLTQYEAGPSATQALAWLGADVVKVERPEVGDPGRATGSAASYFHHWNANKRSVALDLASAEGRALVLELVPRFDVFVENLGPGVIEKLGLSHAAVAAVHPSVIYASVKGFGAEGPYAGYKCFDSVAMAMGGAFSVTGEDGGPPLPPGITVGDCGTGMQLALAITAAYVQKLRTGDGQYIELSMQEAVTYYLRTRLAIGGQWGEAAAPRTGTGRGALINLYACKPFGPNDHIYLMAVTEGMWRAVPAAIGRPELADDERFASGKGRAVHAEALREAIAAFAAERTKHEAMAVLAEAGIPCGAVLDTAELHRDPHLVARGFVHDVDIPGHGPAKLLGWPARMSASKVPITVAPALGAHTDQVLADELGLDPERLSQLHATRVVG